MLVKGALRPGGRFAVWSASPDDRFAARFRRAGFSSVTAHTVPARGVGGGPRHVIFLGQLDWPPRRSEGDGYAVK
jgi:hypothetical protein